MQRKESLHSPQKTMICSRCALRANHPWVSILVQNTLAKENFIIKMEVSIYEMVIFLETDNYDSKLG